MKTIFEWIVSERKTKTLKCLVSRMKTKFERIASENKTNTLKEKKILRMKTSI